MAIYKHSIFSFFCSCYPPSCCAFTLLLQLPTLSTLHWATVVFSATVHLCVKVSNTHQGEPINWKPQTFFSLKCFAKLPHYTYIYEPLHNLKVWSFVLIIYFRKKKEVCEAPFLTGYIYWGCMSENLFRIHWAFL